ncbi:hypothetical protein RPYSC3_47900 [Rhodopseudomonas palustris]|nr:hypothetical protein RPYSC3_47900 [Rhodopseudomonas palustris]
MPVLARPAAGGKYEIVAGNRRLRAAAEAGLTRIPARVVEMTDTEAREAQIVENLQRADIHPIDEADAYRKLIETQRYEISDLAVKFGKSETFVRDRLALTDLIAIGKKAFRDGLITIGHAALVARLDAKTQKDALNDELNIDDDTEWRRVPSVAQLREWIFRKTLQTSMKSPPWKDDEQMREMLGGCEECNGKGADLFGKRTADACSNPKCYANRLNAFIAIKLRENPDLVRLTDNYTNEGDIIGTSSYKAIKSKKDRCKHAEGAIVVQGDSIGQTFDICRAPECNKHWPTSRPGGHYKPTAEEREARKKQRQADKERDEKRAKAITAALEKVSFPLTAKQLDVLLDSVFEKFDYTEFEPICKRHEIEVPKVDWGHRDYAGSLKSFIKEKSAEEKLRLIFEIITETQWHDERMKSLKRL